MFSFKLATLLFGLCLLVKSETTRNVTTTRYDERKDVTSKSSTSSTTSSSRTANDATCSSSVSKKVGSLLGPSEEAVISCQCSAGSGSSDLPCPNFSFLEGEEYIFIDKRELDISSDSCSLLYKLRLRSNIKVGTQRVTLVCVIPGTDETLGRLDVYTDTPSPDRSPGARTRLSIYLVLAIVVFLLLTLSLFGLLFRWQIRSRRRAQRSALYRSPFVQPQTNYGFAGNPDLGSDSPPTYNEATLSQSAAFKEKLGQVANPSQQQQQQTEEQRTGLQQVKETQPTPIHASNPPVLPF